MLGNIREFISVVQDGIASNNNIRQTLLEVHKVTNIFNKDKPADLPRTESQVNYGTGGKLLEKYQEQWVEIHNNAEQNAKAAEDVDRKILEINEVMERRLKSANELAQNLSCIPTLTAKVAEVMDSLKNIQELIKTAEEELVEFEDIVERSKMEKWKLDHQYHLTLYKEKKMMALEEVRNKLASEQSMEREKRQMAELQLRRDNSSIAFNQDMAKYLAGVPITPTAAPKVTLEQIQLDVDKSDLEKFLDS